MTSEVPFKWGNFVTCKSCLHAAVWKSLEGTHPRAMPGDGDGHFSFLIHMLLYPI